MEATFIKAILSRVFAKTSRSTVLKPMAWLVGLCAPASISAFHFNAPNWVGTMFSIFSAVAILTYIFSYIYFMFKDPEVLRSEGFLIQQLAIEKGFVGDNEAGYIQAQDLAVRGELGSAMVDEPSEGKKE